MPKRHFHHATNIAMAKRATKGKQCLSGSGNSTAHILNRGNQGKQARSPRLLIRFDGIRPAPGIMFHSLLPPLCLNPILWQSAKTRPDLSHIAFFLAISRDKPVSSLFMFVGKWLTAGNMHPLSNRPVGTALTRIEIPWPSSFIHCIFITQNSAFWHKESISVPAVCRWMRRGQSYLWAQASLLPPSATLKAPAKCTRLTLTQR